MVAKETRVEAKPAKVKKSSKSGKGKAKETEADSDSDGDDEKLEAAYLKSQSAAAAKTDDKSSDSDTEDEDEDVDPTTLVHESVKKSSKKARGPKVKHVPSEETPELRDQRTVFVGNLPLEVASKKVCSSLIKFLLCAFTNRVFSL